jgi:carbamoyl-phosphate synthase large subunit
MNAIAGQSTKTVAVTGLHRGDNPQPGAAVVASLRRRFPDLRIIGLSYDPLESSLFCRGNERVDATYLLPYPGVGPDALLERLDTILAHENLDFVIPCLDTEISNYISLNSALAERGIQIVLPTKQSLDRRSKSNLAELCDDLDVPFARTKDAQNPETLAEFADDIGYPVYIKGKHYEALLVNSRQQLFESFAKIMRTWGGPVIAQEALVGEEYDLVGLGDGEGRMTGHCTIRKMLRTPAGKGFAGVVVIDPALEEMGRRIIESLRWNGPFELEFIKVSGRPHVLFEINPRFPAWVDFPSQIGCNLPAQLFERLLDVELSPLEVCKPGQMYIRHSVDLVGDIADLAEMASTGERLHAPRPQQLEAIG